MKKRFALFFLMMAFARLYWEIVEPMIVDPTPETNYTIGKSDAVGIFVIIIMAFLLAILNTFKSKRNGKNNP